MGLLKKIFSKRFQSDLYRDFWDWFQKNEKGFYSVIKNKGNIEEAFFNQFTSKLKDVGKDIFCLTGMSNDNTVELVFTAEGVIKNIVFIEELVTAAPKIKGWKFTALKPALDIKNVVINMSGYSFNSENIWFCENDDDEYPDEINISIVHSDLVEDNWQAITNGVYVFLNNYIGELNFATTIDNMKVIGKALANGPLIPVEKLKPYLKWREKEFVEKYGSMHHSSENDHYATLKVALKNGNSLIATMNMDLLEWYGKTSHPWIGEFEIKYKGENGGGMPDKTVAELLNTIEEKICEELKDADGYLNVGRQTAESIREIYFACKDFRKPSKVFDKVKRHFDDKFEISYNIYKDKYWRSFNRFKQN
ncbi:DUF695 domain-containing protein [Parafilimonas sp.]|uniref:DUF695 domain-containing protein n=1 Tax=Parafilimonas sp. TaxID=1969739 RepID=UPI003F809AAF